LRLFFSLQVPSPRSLRDIFHCQIIVYIHLGGSSNATKRIFLFTNDDAPLENNSDEQDKVVQVMRSEYETLEGGLRECLPSFAEPFRARG